MYMPAAFTVEDRGLIVEVLRQTAFGHLVTTVPDGTASGLNATALPFVIDEDLATLRAHFSRANNHWRSIDGQNALFIVPTHDAYVSPRWYQSKAEHGKVVPTWNYELIHLHGTVTIHDDPVWTLDLVSTLTDQNEHEASKTGAGDAWGVADAPEDFIAGQLKAIVGVEFTITEIEAKRKLSQNRAEPDRLGARAGLAASADHGDNDLARLMPDSLS